LTPESSEKADMSGTKERRNVGIMAHIDAGKTTVTERILFHAGRIRKTGEVHDGNATMDFLEEERRRGITIQSAATSVTWNDADITILDTPGHVDFTAEVERSLRVLDGAIAVFCGVAGVQAQSETVWRQADRYGIPRLSFVNKMDRVGADLDRTLLQIRDRLDITPLPLQLPIGTESDLSGVLDLVRERAIVFEEQADGHAYREIPVPEEERPRLAEGRERLIDAVSHFSDEILERYVAEEEISPEALATAIRGATLGGKATPVLLGTALRNKGVQLLLDAVVDYLPAPEDMPPIEGVEPRSGDTVTREPRPDAPASVLSFKTVADQAGDLTFLRVYSGTIQKGDLLINPRTRKTVRIGRLLRIHAKHREPVDRAVAGDIVAAMGLKDTATGDTLANRDEPVALGAMSFPDAVISMAIQPESRAERDRLAHALSRLMREDPTFRAATDEETGELVIAGMGELHLEVVRSRLHEVLARHVKQTGGRGQFAVAQVRFEPGGEGQGVAFESEVVGGAVPREYHSSVAAGIRDVAEEGHELRFPFVNLRAVLTDGKHHEVDSSDTAFRAAGRIALRSAIDKVGVTILEPRVRFLVEVPDEHLGDVLADLTTRRAEVENLEMDGSHRRILGRVPVGELFSYSTQLRSLTQGRGTFHTEAGDYAAVPASIAEEIARDARARRRGVQPAAV
jgi:elongation factor G